MVKIINTTGKTEKFDSKDIEGELKAVGIPERIAEEVAERVEDRVADGWSTMQIREQTQVELSRIEEDIRRGRDTFTGKMQSSTARDDRECECNCGSEAPENSMEQPSATGERSRQVPRTTNRVELHSE